jgi:hypothetical protein
MQLVCIISVTMLPEITELRYKNFQVLECQQQNYCLILQHWFSILCKALSLALREGPELRTFEDMVLRILGLKMAELIGHW